MRIGTVSRDDVGIVPYEQKGSYCSCMAVSW